MPALGFGGNPDASKAILALGLMILVDRVPHTLVVADLQGREWGERMASYTGVVYFFKYLLAIFSAGPLGRFGDRFGNRLAVAGVLFLVALPTYILLLFGITAFGLRMWSVAVVFSGFTASSISGSPACYALINELSAPDEVEAFLGLGFACLSMFWMIGNFVGIFIRHYFSEEAVLVFVSLLSAFCFALLASIRSPRWRRSELSEPWQNLDSELARRLERREKLQERRRRSSLANIGNVVEAAETRPMALLLGTIRFAMEDQKLGALCLLAALISIPETVLFDVQMQFIYQVFGLLGASEDPASDAAQRTHLALVNVTAVQLSFAFGSSLVGYLAKKYTAFLVMLWLVPVVAVTQSLPMLLPLLPFVWAVVVTGALMGFSMIVLPPLQALVAQESPPERASEAMGAIGSAKAFATMLGNLLVSFLVPVLGSRNLWVLFPASGLVSFSGLLLLRQMKEGADKASLTAAVLEEVELAARKQEQEAQPEAPVPLVAPLLDDSFVENFMARQSVIPIQ